jgi:hypothetical protein
LLFLALPLLVLLPPSWPVLRSLLASLLFLSLVIAFRPATNLRYLVPALPGMTLASAYLLAAGLRKWVPRPGSRRMLAGIIVALALLPTWVAGADRWRSAGAAMDPLLGRISPQAFVESPQGPLGGLAPMIRAVNELPRDQTRTLFILEARGLYFGSSITQDNRLLNWPALVPILDQDSCLQSLGFTHVLVNHGALAYYASRGLDPAILGWSHFETFRDRCLTPMLQTETHTLYAVES